MMGKLEGVDLMSFIGNLLWLVLGGIILGIMWFLFGFLWCLTIVGIPIGIQCFKMADLQFLPFGRDVFYDQAGAGSMLLNIFWIVFGGIELAAVNLFIGILFCMTIIGIPFGLQSFKLAKLSLMPFGARIRRVR